MGGNNDALASLQFWRDATFPIGQDAGDSVLQALGCGMAMPA